MKYFTIVMLSFTFSYFSSQSIKDNKVSINYIQLPKKKVDEAVTSFFTIYKDSYNSQNSRQLSVYQFKVDSAESDQQAKISNWKESYNSKKEKHLVNLSIWKQNSAKGIVTPKPIEPIWPKYPEPYFLFPPPLTKGYSELMSKNINIAGFNKGNSGVEIEIDNLGLEILSIKGKYAAQKKSYFTTARYKMPIVIKTSYNGQVLVQKQYHNIVGTHTIYNGKTEYDYELWKINIQKENKDIWLDLQKKLWHIAIDDIKNILNSEIGYPKKREETEIYVVKKFQDFSYDKLIDALTFAQTGYAAMSMDRDKSTAKKSLKMAIDIWEKELEEADLQNKKARINAKISGLISANLADAYFWMEDFEKTNYHINKALSQGNLKAKNHCKKLKEDIPDFRTRYNAYVQ
tara:strand:- start:3373 stop:4578 length:1206 start_codon:yes stop_codon:yes gene_type:complete